MHQGQTKSNISNCQQLMQTNTSGSLVVIFKCNPPKNTNKQYFPNNRIQVEIIQDTKKPLVNANCPLPTNTACVLCNERIITPAKHVRLLRDFFETTY